MIAEKPVRSAAGLLDLSLMRLPCKAAAGVLSAPRCWAMWLHLPRPPPGTRFCTVPSVQARARMCLLSEPLRPAILECSLQPDDAALSPGHWTLPRTPGFRGNLRLCTNLSYSACSEKHVCGLWVPSSLPGTPGAPGPPASCVHSCLGLRVAEVGRRRGESPASINLHSPARKMHCFN